MKEYTKSDKELLIKLNFLTELNKINDSSLEELWILDSDPDMLMTNDKKKPILFVDLDILVVYLGLDIPADKTYSKIEEDFVTKARTCGEAMNTTIEKLLCKAVYELSLHSEKSQKPKMLEISPGNFLEVRKYLNNLCEKYPDVIKKGNLFFD